MNLVLFVAGRIGDGSDAGGLVHLMRQTQLGLVTAAGSCEGGASEE